MCTEIQKLILEGQIPDAEQETKNLYPHLLDKNPDLLFMLRCRHFVELVGRSMARKGKGLDDPSSPAPPVHDSSCNGNLRSNDTADGAEDMEITYSNGYQNGCGDEMGMLLCHCYSLI